MKPRTPFILALAAFAFFQAAPLAAEELSRSEAKLLRKANFWTFQKAARPELPASGPTKHPNPIDAFITAKLAAENLQMSPPADRRTLARRLHFGLTGLPPTPSELRSFLNDPSSGACEKRVDQLLASPRYGERWARYWLDIVHFGESHGYDKDKPRPNAWPYRDYVIRAANNDLPFSRFVQEQVAGDVLFPSHPDATIATGFLAAGPWDFVGHVELPESKTDGLIARYNDRDDMVMTTMTSFLSLTVHCARCHDHKFDPISQEEYYRLQAVFAGVDRADRPVELNPGVHATRQKLAAEKAGLAEFLRGAEKPVADQRNALAAALPNQVQPPQGARLRTLGYHSAIEKSPEAAKWVQLDFPTAIEMDAVGLVPAFEAYGGHPGPAFGFPNRFRIDVSDSPTFEKFVTLRDETARDFPSPGNAAVIAQANGVRAKHVRVTATRLWKRTDDWIFALGEAWVISGGTNVASAASIQSLDSIEAAPSWARANLTDGVGVVSNGSDWQVWLANEKAVADLARRAEESLSPETKAQVRISKARLAEIDAELKALPSPTMVYAAATDFKASGSFKPAGKPRPVHLLKRGDVKQPVREVDPGALRFLPGLSSSLDVQAGDEGSRRAALARWLTHSENFLLRRSIVNRVWQFHFGRGLVDSPNDFGHMGSLPSHPELLDWLAFWFIDHGESLKALHKLIVSSDAYRQASADNPAASLADSDNRFLWRMNRSRLDAEQIRDSILLVSGQLDDRMGGPSDQQFVFKDDHSPIYDYTSYDVDSPGARRRGVYRFIVRSVPDPLMDALDCPDSSLLTGKRNVTVTALQALATWNNPFVLAQAKHFSERLQREAPTLAQQIGRAFDLALNRPPTESESQRMASFAQEHGLANACRVIFNLSEFMFID